MLIEKLKLIFEGVLYHTIYKVIATMINVKPKYVYTLLYTLYDFNCYLLRSQSYTDLVSYC